MITPKYTGFYKPGLKIKAAELSLRPADANARTPTPSGEAAQNRAGYIQLIQRAEQRVERRTDSESRPKAA